jgi:protocatechuate 3,4-dioxygenase beta subunit
MLRLFRVPLKLDVYMLLLLVCVPAWSQDPAVLIQGTVVDLLTGRALSGVQVTLGETLTLTDGAGRFALQAVSASAAVPLSFAHSGYVRTSVIADPQNRNIVVGLTRAGAVSGRLTDERGDPLEGIQVQLYRRTFDEHGAEGVMEAFSARTNDRGEYRLYWVTPGTYYASAKLNDPQDSVGNSNAPVRYRYSNTYYPGVGDIADAVRLTVTTGSDLNGIDWSLRSALRTEFSISGRVIDSRTGQGGGSTITLAKLMAGGSNSAVLNADAEGMFTFKDVAPGKYWLGASSQQVQGEAGAAAQIEITVTNQNLEGVTLTMTPGTTISGRVTLEGPFANIVSETVGVILQPLASTSTPPFQRIQPDGTFMIPSVLPGPYRLVMSLPPDYFVREARMGPIDVLAQTLVVAEAAAGPLQIVISSNSGQLDGIVVDSRRQPLAGIEAVLIPDRQRDRKDLYLKTRTDAQGQFSLQAIPPGTYKLFAWERLEQYGYFDFSVVQQAETQATPVRVIELSKQTIEVRSIP